MKKCAHSRIGAGFERLATDVRYALRALGKVSGLLRRRHRHFRARDRRQHRHLQRPQRCAHRTAPVPRSPSGWRSSGPIGATVGYPRGPLAGPELVDLRARSTTIEAVDGIWSNTAALSGDGNPEQLRIGLVTTGFFRTLGVDAGLRTHVRSGRRREQRTVADPSLVGPLATALRRKAQTSSASASWSTAHPTTVIGVMPRDFDCGCRQTPTSPRRCRPGTCCRPTSRDGLAASSSFESSPGCDLESNSIK